MVYTEKLSLRWIRDCVQPYLFGYYGLTPQIVRMLETRAELEALAGPLKGTSIPLSGDQISIGREPSNVVSVVDAGVSRKHCIILQEGGGFKIQDLNSRNSTFVNGVPVTERALISGDEIKIGNSLFVFVLPETEKAKSASTSLEFNKTGA